MKDFDRKRRCPHYSFQIYDQDGNYLTCWYQFGRPSGIFIDADDDLFVSDS